jgi:hypothetical protein
VSRPVTITESNNTVEIREDAPVVTPEPWYQGLATVPTSQGSATVTADATPHTKGAWTEVIASNAGTTSALFCTVTNVGLNGNNTATLIDIGVGASGSESAIVSNIAVGGASASGFGGGIGFVLPVSIASSSRIAVRSQAFIASDTAAISIDTFALGDSTTVPTTLDCLGTSTSTSEGTLVSTSYAEVVASTAQAYEALIIVPSWSLSSGSTYGSEIIVATGTVGNEIDIAKNEAYKTSGEQAWNVPYISSITDTTVASGTRLSAKAPGGGFYVALIGVPAA